MSAVGEIKQKIMYLFVSSINPNLYLKDKIEVDENRLSVGRKLYF